MKIFISVLSVILFSVCSFAATTQSGQLDGGKYCRTVKTPAGFFGRPAGESLHCVTFSQGKMRDNANTFFGNPPTTQDYKLYRNFIYVKTIENNWEKTAYKYTEGEIYYNGVLMDMINTHQ